MVVRGQARLGLPRWLRSDHFSTAVRSRMWRTCRFLWIQRVILGTTRRARRIAPNNSNSLPQRACAAEQCRRRHLLRTPARESGIGWKRGSTRRVRPLRQQVTMLSGSDGLTGRSDGVTMIRSICRALELILPGPYAFPPQVRSPAAGVVPSGRGRRPGTCGRGPEASRRSRSAPSPAPPRTPTPSRARGGCVRRPFREPTVARG